MLTKTLFRRRRSLLAGSALTVMLTVGLVAVAPQFSSPANAQTGPSCADPVTSAPTGPATVSAAWTRYGKVLVVGSGDYARCSLYLLTSDKLHALTGAPFACSDNTNATGSPCDTVLWQALLTQGAPIAGRGVNPTLLGTVTRTDLPGLGPVQQVTYAGLPLYRFFQDETPGETEGANLFDPVTSPTGIWYLVQPSRAGPHRVKRSCSSRPRRSAAAGPGQTVLAATMNPDFSGFPQARFPVYTLSRDHHKSACRGVCAAVYWPPVLTSKRPQAGPGVDRARAGDHRQARRHPPGDLQRPAAVPVLQRRVYPRLAVQRRDGQHQRSGCAHPVGRVQHDPAAAPRTSAF